MSSHSDDSRRKAKRAPRDSRGFIYHSSLMAESTGAPGFKVQSLNQKDFLYDDLSKRLKLGLLPEDAMTGMLNSTIGLAASVKLPVDVLAGWLREEARAYKKEQKAGGLMALLDTPDVPRPFEDQMHDHFFRSR